jgi:hypothetical protein
MLSVRKRATKKLVGAQVAFPQPIFSIFISQIPTAIDHAKDRLFPLKVIWETVAQILMVTPIWLVGSFKSLASKGPTNFYPC